MQALDHLPLQRDDALIGIFRPGKNFNDAAGMGHFILGRREGPVGRFDLARMDERLAVKPHGSALRAFRLETRTITKIIVNAVKHSDPAGTRGKNDLHQPRDEIRSPRLRAHARFPRYIVRPDHKTGEAHCGTMPKNSNFVGIDNAARRLDHRPDTNCRVGIPPIKPIGGVDYILRTFDLGQEDRIGSHLCRRRNIVLAPRRFRRIDPYNSLEANLRVGCKMRRQCIARRNLYLRRNRILQIIDHAIRWKGQRLLQSASIGSRNEQDGTARTKNCFHVPICAPNRVDTQDPEPARKRYSEATPRPMFDNYANLVYRARSEKLDALSRQDYALGLTAGLSKRMTARRIFREKGRELRPIGQFRPQTLTLGQADVNQFARLQISNRQVQDMDKFTKLTGVAAPLPIVNIDTDMIIPKDYLKTIKRTGLSKGLFAEMRFNEDGTENPDFVLNKPGYRNAQILVAGDNFGCGSSREHAPWALLDFGIRCVISTSFADIFYNNCFKNGILPIKVSQEDLDKLMDDASRGANATLTVDLEAKEIHGPDGGTISFDLDDFKRHCLLNGLDDIGLTMEKAGSIDAFEAKRAEQRPWA